MYVCHFVKDVFVCICMFACSGLCGYGEWVCLVYVGCCVYVFELVIVCVFFEMRRAISIKISLFSTCKENLVKIYCWFYCLLSCYDSKCMIFKLKNKIPSASILAPVHHSTYINF